MASSGAEVPNATSVKAMMKGATFTASHKQAMRKVGK